MDVLSSAMDNFWKILCFFLLLYILRTIELRKKSKTKVEKGEYALNIIINTDHDMTKGKIVAQIGHAMSNVMDHLFDNRELLKAWKENGEAKIVLKASSEQISEVIKQAKKKGITHNKIFDAGRTQVIPGANTIVTLGPALKSTLKEISGSLKLY